MNREEIKENLIDCAKFYCERQGFDEDTIQVDYFGACTIVSFGSVERFGYEISVDVWRENEINRIILSCGKNNKKQSVYSESREQSLLDAFLYKLVEFDIWIEETLEKLEKRF